MTWTFKDFNSIQIVYEDAHTALYRGTRIKDQKSVLIKVLKPEFQTSKSIQRLKNSFNIGKAIKSGPIIKPISLEKSHGSYILVSEDFPGRPIQASDCDSLRSFLEWSIRLTNALADLHSQKIIHKDIRPQNILIDPDSQEVRFINLDIASLIQSSEQLSVDPNVIEGSFPYMAPEQTGRTNYAMDGRTDLYALGVTLYELRSGKLPFQANDPLEWIHAHLAQSPQSIIKYSPETPVVVSNIINKLLSKVPEERYQSSAGLRDDLEKCLERLNDKGVIDSFPLGERDISVQFRIPHKLYGRKMEVEQLINSFEEVISTSNPRLLLVSGYSGIGKTSLVKELNIPIAREKGFFIQGKFDQYKRGIPYSIISQAFHTLISQILAEPKEQIDLWRNRLTDVLGINGRLIIELIPEVELLIGNQPPIQALPLEENERRFQMVVQQFVNAFAKKEHPLVIFIDDLQWADFASLKLMEEIMGYSETHYLFIIGAFRDNEVSPSHPLMMTIESMRRKECRIDQLVLGPLSRQDVNELVMSTLHRPYGDVALLAQLIYEKTRGNPFFTIQFLKSLEREKLIWFDEKHLEWEWNLKEIQTQNYSDNVVDLMERRIRQLPESAQKIIGHAACIGNTFDITLLATIAGINEKQLVHELLELTRVGLVMHLESSYRFTHDRIQQAAMLFLQADEQQKVHLLIGRTLQKQTPENKLTEHIFEIVSHCNLAIPLITDKAERTHLAELNLQAVIRAEAAAAYAPAVSYSNTGLALLNDPWIDHYDLTFALYLKKAQNEYLNKSFNDSMKSIDELLKHARNNLEKAAIYALGIQVHTNRVEPMLATQMALDYLKLFGLHLPLQPTMEEVEAEYQQVFKTLGNRSIESIGNLPELTDPNIHALLAIISVTLPPALITNTKLWALMVCHANRLNLTHGNSEFSSLAYCTLAMISGAFFEKYQEGYSFGRVAIDLAEKYPNSAIRSSVYMSFGNMVSHWSRPWEECIPFIIKAINEGIKSGNLTWACYSSNLLISAILTKGDLLEEVWKESERRLDFVHKANFPAQENGIITNQLFIQKMRGYGHIDEAIHNKNVTSIPWPIEICWHYIRRMQAHTIFEEYDEALRAADLAEPLLWTSPNFMQVADFVFYKALALTQTGSKEVQSHRQKLSVWFQNCPANFADRYFIIEAEIARLNKQELEAQKLYEKAILAARESGFIQNEALAFELAAKFNYEQGNKVIAGSFLQEAYKRYSRWGAEEKLKNLTQKYQGIFSGDWVPTFESMVTTSKELDLFSVLKTSQAISGEMETDKLSAALMKILMEQSGADKGCLILAQDENFTIEATAKFHGGELEVKLLPSIPVAESQLIPASLVQYVIRSHETAIIEDATVELGTFKSDPYFVKHGPRSVLCLPFIFQTKVAGLFYLENSFTSGVFSPNRIEVLKLLASQAAISLENSYFLARELAAKKEANFLAEASSLIAESLELDVTLQSLSKHIVKGLGDWCEFDVVEGERIVRHAGAHSSPEKNKYLEELASRYPPTLESPHPSSRVFQSKEPLLIQSLDLADIRRHCIDDHHFELVKNLGTRSLIALPMQARGKTLGVLTIASGKDNYYNEKKLNLGIELARRTAVAIENIFLYRHAQEAIKIRENFISVASHELRTPLSTLKLQLQLIIRYIQKKEVSYIGNKGKEVERLMHASDSQINKLTSLIEAMLNISHLSKEKKIRLQKEDIDLKKLVTEVVDTLTPEIEAASSRITITDGQQIIGHWDKLRLEQVITNLITNAFKYGKGKPIEVRIYREGQEATIAVTDQGIGIPKQHQNKIFKIFERAVTPDEASGLGLGLFITKQIVKAHGGRIWVESEFGQGSTFYVQLPITDTSS